MTYSDTYLRGSTSTYKLVKYLKLKSNFIKCVLSKLINLKNNKSALANTKFIYCRSNAKYITTIRIIFNRTAVNYFRFTDVFSIKFNLLFLIYIIQNFLKVYFDCFVIAVVSFRNFILFYFLFFVVFVLVLYARGPSEPRLLPDRE